MSGPGGYGRYTDDVERVQCPRAADAETRCIARDGHAALDEDWVCAGCGERPDVLMRELADARLAGAVEFLKSRKANVIWSCARTLAGLIRDATEPQPQPEPEPPKQPRMRVFQGEAADLSDDDIIRSKHEFGGGFTEDLDG